MQTCIALLRGINVGGNNMIPMKDLRLLVEHTRRFRHVEAGDARRAAPRRSGHPRNWRTVTTLLEMAEGARA